VEEIAREFGNKFGRELLAELSNFRFPVSLETYKRFSRPFETSQEILIPESIYEYIKNHILHGIEGVEDLLKSFEFDAYDPQAVEKNFDHLYGLEKDELLDIDVEPDEDYGEWPFDYIPYLGYLFNNYGLEDNDYCWEDILDNLDDHKKELIYRRLYDDTHRKALFARYMFWRWEVSFLSEEDEPGNPFDDASEFLKKPPR
jgi:hypothetical protein